MGLGHDRFGAEITIDFKSVLAFSIMILVLLTTFISPLIFLSNYSATDCDPKIEPYTFTRDRLVNIDTEPNNNYTTASKIVYDISGTTHIFDAHVGASNDPNDFWELKINNTGSSNPDKIKIALILNETIAGPNGVYMNLYDAEYHKLGSTDVAVEPDPNYLTLIGQVKPIVYLEVKSNIQDTDFKYVLSIINETEGKNNVFTDDESFITARDVNITMGDSFTAEYLDNSYDFADFYKFYTRKDQKISLDLQISSNSQEDFDLFLYSEPNIKSLVASSENFNLNEEIEYFSPDNRTYYLRVGIKNIADEILRNRGYYKLICQGNLPPQWNNSFQDVYIMYEDGPDLDIDLSKAFHELNPDDVAIIELWDPNFQGTGGWVSAEMFTSIDLKNLTINYQPDSSIELKVKRDRFGTDIIRIRATDSLQERYNYKEITIYIKPVNDPPVLRGTNKWSLGYGLSVSDGTKIYCDTGNIFDCQITAYDVDPNDKLTFSDNTEMFDIDPDTGEIEFKATYNYTGINLVNITVTDNGTPSASTTRTFEFIINRSGLFPIVKLLSVPDNSVLVTLKPNFEWDQTNGLFESTLYYKFYLSNDINLVQKFDRKALIITIKDNLSYEFPEELKDKTKYYWTVIPNDGDVQGECSNGIFSFEINLDEPIPKVNIIYPLNKQIITTESVTLKWDLEYSGFKKVSYKIFVSNNEDELLNPATEPKVISEKEYRVPSLYYSTSYYWRVIPIITGVYGYEELSEINMFYVAVNIPRVQMVNPANTSIILPGEVITLSWDIEHPVPNKERMVKSVLFWGITPEFDQTNGIDRGYDRNYILPELDQRTYYWKVVPYIDGLRGVESETWSFIVKDIEVPRAILTSPLNTTFYTDDEIQVVEFHWYVDFDGEFDPQNLWFDIYLDNTTNDTNRMVRINSDKYRQMYYAMVLPVEVNKIYYWYVIPYLQTTEGLIRGISSPSIVNFTFGPRHIKYEISMELEKTEINIEPGSRDKVMLIIKNAGNIEATIDIYAYVDDQGVAFINPILELKTVVIAENERKVLSISIMVLSNAKPDKYNLTLEAIVRQSTIINAKDVILINITSPDSDFDPEHNDKTLIEQYPFLWLIIVIILFLISMSLYTKIKRHKLLEHQRREKIFNYVKENPGEHFRGIQKALELEVGVLAHHINKLEREEFIKSRQDGKYRRFYPMDAKINIKLILSDLQEKILSWIKNNPGATGKNIAFSLGVDKKLVNYHVTILEKGGFIYTEPRGRERQCYSIQT